MPRKVIIAGAGPVACLTALSLANKGWDVQLWESRPGAQSCSPRRAGDVTRSPALALFACFLLAADPRSDKGKAESVRSVNLAISSRGISAIQAVEPDLGPSRARSPFSLPRPCAEPSRVATVDQFLALALPMKGRMIWDFDNKCAAFLLACPSRVFRSPQLVIDTARTRSCMTRSTAAASTRSRARSCRPRSCRAPRPTRA